jgi:hypothetical protein
LEVFNGVFQTLVKLLKHILSDVFEKMDKKGARKERPVVGDLIVGGQTKKACL